MPREFPKPKFTAGTKVSANFDCCIRNGHYLGIGVFAYQRGDQGTIMDCKGNRVIVKVNGDLLDTLARDWTPTPKHKFPDRVILGVGHPWTTGRLVDKKTPHDNVMLLKSHDGFSPLNLYFPKVLLTRKTPQYRLVLELV